MTNMHALVTLEKIKLLTEQEKANLLNTLGTELVIEMINRPSVDLSEQHKQKIKNSISKEFAVRLLEVFPTNIIFKEIAEQ